MSSEPDARRRMAWLGALLTGLVGALLLLTPLGAQLADWSYDLTAVCRRRVATEDVALIYMDWDSHVRLGQEPSQRWDRALHARLLERLKQVGARAVVLDVVFFPATNNAAADAELVRAAREHGNVVVAGLVSPDLHAGEVIGWKLTKPFPALEAVAGWGLAEVGAEGGSVRQHYFRRDFEAPSLAWRAAQVAWPELHREPYRERWMNYYGPPGWLTHYSYWEVLGSNAIPMAAFSNKVVFVGARYEVGMVGGKGADEFRTPYTPFTGRRSPGVEVLATAYLNIVRDDALGRKPALVEALLVGIVGALLALGMNRCPPWLAAGMSIVAILAVAIVSIGLNWATGVWYPWLVLVVVQIPLALLWSLLAAAQQGFARPIPMPAFDLNAEEELRIRRELERARSATPFEPSREPAPVNSEAATVEADKANDSFRQIADHQLLRRIGKGAYGEVWLARSVIGTYHAVKLVYRNSFADAAPFEREFNGLRKFTPISNTHPGFVHVLHVGRNDAEGFIYYVMEVADDEACGQNIVPETYSPRTLAKVLRDRKRLPLEECLRLGVDLADALQVLHNNQLIHRDIKPANIIFVKGAAKLADIGLVTEAADAGGVTYLGTKGYIPPEGPGSSTGDVYSLGKVLYEASVGLEVTRFPELPPTLAAAPREDAFFKMNEILLKACEQSPGKRFGSAAALHAALCQLLHQLNSIKP